MDKHHDLIMDCLTGEMVPDIGAEQNRQSILRFLLDRKGYSKDSIISCYPLVFDVSGESYSSRIDLVIKLGSRPMMAMRCVPGSVASAEREIIAAARIACEGQIPLAVSTDGVDALVFNALTGKTLGRGLESIPSMEELRVQAESLPLQILDQTRLDKMKVVFRTYDMENVNRL